jgi:hypothetical protein
VGRILVGLLVRIFHNRDIGEGEKIERGLIEIPYFIPVDARRLQAEQTVWLNGI